MSKHGYFPGPYFPAFRLNTERYSVSLRIQSECGEIRTRKNSIFGHFSRSVGKEQLKSLWKISWTQIRDIDWYLDTNSTNTMLTLATKNLMTIKVTSIYTSRPLGATYFQVVLWRHFSIVARLIWHSLFYDGHFSRRWLPLVIILNSNRTKLE